jgi:nitroreductase
LRLDGLPEAELPEAARAFLGFMETRYACKLFDLARPVPAALVAYLIECVRLSPSSFGLEHTRLIAALEPALRAELAKASGGQDPVATAPLVLVFLAPRAEAYEPGSDFVRNRAERFPGGLPVFRADYEGYYAFLRREGRLEDWARAQSYLAVANAMTGAAAAGLDSCAIEGFDEAAVLAALGYPPEPWTACLMAAFGYRAEARRERFRLEAGEMSELRQGL